MVARAAGAVRNDLLTMLGRDRARSLGAGPKG
jgi:hypothetical protein